MTRSNSEKFWNLIAVRTARSSEETASSLLFELGATGTIVLEESEEKISVGGYFAESADTNGIRGAVVGAFERDGTEAVVSVTTVPDQDWMQKWKEGFEAIEIGERLIVAPSWKMPGSESPRLVVQIDPGMAFGTGTHETTRLCLELIERYFQGGRLLDVGTGTGVLAIAAAMIKPGSQIVAIDVDPVAVEVARENIAINNQSAIDVREAEPREFAGRNFDMVVANLTAEVIADLMQDLAACSKKDGWMILSGILNELRPDVESALERAGLKIVERRDAGEWSALAAKLVHTH